LIDKSIDLLVLITCLFGVQTWNTSTGNEELIVTQMPLPGTITDLWRLITDESCYTIVMLDEPDTDEYRV